MREELKKKSGYRRNRISIYLVLLIALLLKAASMSFGDGEASPAQTGEAGNAMVIDDFSSGNGISTLGNQWRLMTDQVMGGVSEGNYAVGSQDGVPFMRLTGNVSLENRGGFVQVVLPLTREGKFFNAEEYAGIEIRVRGNGERYYIHLRTAQTTLPWQHFSAGFQTDEEWKTVRIPFDSFQSQNMRSADLNISKLKRMGLVAANKVFQADVSISYVGFYR
jgi:hypothetical protein